MSFVRSGGEEPVERRTLVERNAYRTACDRDAEPGGNRRRTRQDTCSSEERRELDMALLRQAYLALNQKAARGMDRMSWEDYGSDRPWCINPRFPRSNARINP
jgi:hypothetical protein